MKKQTALLLSSIALATVANAAPISWTANDITPNATDISTTGTVVDARNGGSSDVTVNGVTFKSVANSGNLFDSLFASDSIGNRGHGNGYVTDANYRSFLAFGQRSGRLGFDVAPRSEPTEVWTTVNLSGLTIGNTYQIQIWHSDGNFQNPTSDGVFGIQGLLLGNGSGGDPSLVTGTMLLRETFDNQTSQVGGTGQYGLGTFVADSATQSFNLRSYNNVDTTPSATNSDHFSNGWQLRDLGVTGPDESAPTPSPMTWTSLPVAAGDSSITMTATTASDDSGVEYYFTETSGNSGGSNSGWQDSPSYTDEGLDPETTYSYTVTARDKSPAQNATDPSAPPVSTTTDAVDNVPPTPGTMSFAAAPSAGGPYSISMTATTAADASGVEYFFDETSGNPGGSDSGWQDSASYTDDELDPNTEYTYTVRARDKSALQNPTIASPAASATTNNIDNIPPTPSPMTFLVAPLATTSSAITMTASTASDPSGVEYYFTETSGNPGGDDSGWQDSTTYIDTGLVPSTQYTYTVTARDKGPLQNATSASPAASDTTNPTATITWIADNITNDVGNISTNGTPVNARNGSTSSQFVNGTVFESAENSGNLFDSLFGNDSLTTRGYGSVVTALSYQTFLKSGQRSGRLNFNTPPRTEPTEDWATATFTGLTVGNIYEIQIWASDVGFSADGVVQRRALVLGNGSPGAPVFGTDTQLFYEVEDFGAGQYGTGTFVAVASTQSFNVQAYDNLDSTPIARTSDHFSNGMQIRDLGSSVTDYDQWASSQGWIPSDLNTGANDDYDRDGLSNEFERIFGLDSSNPSSLSPFQSLLNLTSGTFDYTRRTQLLTGLAYKVNYSTDLDHWFEDTNAVQTLKSTSNNVEVVGVQISPALLNESKLFIRLSTETAVPPAPAPRLSSLWGSGNTITLGFTEEMDGSGATNTDNYNVELDGGGAATLTGASLSPDSKTVTLTLGSPLGINSAYNVTTGNLTGSGGKPLAGNNTAQFYSWDNEPTGIKVFILAGQSNMVGYGYSEEGGNPAWTPTNGEPKTMIGGPGSLRYLAKNNGLYPEYDYTSLLTNPSDTDSAWKTRPDVKVWWEQGVSGNLNGTEGFGDLGPPFRGGNTAWYGPEYGFGQVIGDYYSGASETPVLIIKAAWGGHSLGGNFRPPSAVADRGGVVGTSYTEIFDNARNLLSNLATKFPAAQYPEFAAVGYRYEIVGFAFHQGYTDRVSPPISPEYVENLPDFIHDVRSAFGKPDMPFTIASTGMDTNFVELSPYPNYTEVEQAQLWVAGNTAPTNVLSSDTRSFMEAAVDSPRNQGFHWHGNARSYFRIGLTLGADMVNLLTP